MQQQEVEMKMMRCKDCRWWIATHATWKEQPARIGTFGVKLDKTQYGKCSNGVERPEAPITENFGCVLFEEEQHSVEREPGGVVEVPAGTLRSEKTWDDFRQMIDQSLIEQAQALSLLKQQDHAKQIRREAAQAALTGLCVAFGAQRGLDMNHYDLAHLAVRWGDALLKRLEQP